MLNKTAKIYIAGRYGMVGSAIERELINSGYRNIIGLKSTQLDLKNQNLVFEYIEKEKPEVVILAAAKVGGIKANMEFPAEFLYDNLIIQNNVIHGSYLAGVKKLLFLASSCIYPRLSPQPMKEEYLLDGKLEPTNESYAIAKIAGLKMCEMYTRQYEVKYNSVMPCNIYGLGDNFSPTHSHVVAGLIRKFHEAKTTNASKVTVWGTGNARRELMFSEDLGNACVHVLNNYEEDGFINIGVGYDYSIRELANIIKKIIDFKGEIVFDSNMPDGMPQKLLDISLLSKLDWKPKYTLEEGIQKTYDWALENKLL